jgi:FAD/FMN-containing dehydrogenase
MFIGSLFRGIANLFRGKMEVDTDPEVLEQYATDQSAFRIVPEAVYYPRDVKDVVSLVERANHDHDEGFEVSLTVRAGGTCMSGGPLNDGWIVDMTKHMNTVEIDPENKTATVEMGAYFRDVEDAAAEHGLMFAPYPSSRRICGIGGMIGNNASGEKSLRFGATSDNVLELEMVLADGTVRTYTEKALKEATEDDEKALVKLHKKHGATLSEAMGQVPKAASGYRLDKVVKDKTFNAIPLFVGSQGTLGIATKATLKLVPIPKYTELLVISAESLPQISDIVQTVFEHNPEGLETFDINTYAVAQKHLKKPAEIIRPYLSEQGHLFILAQFSEKSKKATHAQAVACRDALAAKGYPVHHITEKKIANAAWEVRRNSFTLMRDHNKKGHHAVPCIEDVIVPIPALGTFLQGLQDILTRRKITYGFHGHIGDGSFRIIPVFDFSSKTLTEDIAGLMKEVFALIKSLNGNMSADHSDGIIRSPFLEEFFGKKLYGVFEDVKKLYDPKGILNPHKKVGVTMEYLDACFEAVKGK